MKSRRQAVIAALATAIGLFRFGLRAEQPEQQPKRKEDPKQITWPDSPRSVTQTFTIEPSRAYLSIRLDDLREEHAIQITYRGETISLSPKDIMEALR